MLLSAPSAVAGHWGQYRLLEKSIITALPALPKVSGFPSQPCTDSCPPGSSCQMGWEHNRRGAGTRLRQGCRQGVTQLPPVPFREAVQCAKGVTCGWSLLPGPSHLTRVSATEVCTLSHGRGQSPRTPVFKTLMVCPLLISSFGIKILIGLDCQR